MKNNVLLIYGGESVERDISVLTALQAWGYAEEKYNIIPCYMQGGAFYSGDKLRDIETYSKISKVKERLQFVKGGVKVYKNKLFKKTVNIYSALICCHGGSGENGGLQGMLEVYSIPYTSCGMYQSAVCMAKNLTHSFCEGIGIKMTDYVLLSKGDEINCADLFDRLGDKIVVKPNSLGSSIGLSAAESEEELKRAIELAFLYDNEVLCERFIKGAQELNCAAIRDKDVIISDIESPITAKALLDFEDKYIANGKMSGAKRQFPANIGAELGEKVKSITETVYRALKMKGVVRVDYLYGEDGALYLNEINSVPGSLAYYLFANKYEPDELIEYMIECSVRENNKDKMLVKQFKSTVLSGSRQNGAKTMK